MVTPAPVHTTLWPIIPEAGAEGSPTADDVDVIAVVDAVVIVVVVVNEADWSVIPTA